MIVRFIKDIYKKVFSWLSPYKLWIDFHKYEHRLPVIKQAIFSKKKIKVVFFPINIGMWKHDYLFQLMLNHPRFDPLIVSCFVPVDKWEFQLRNQKAMADFFKSKGYPYMDMYNEEKAQWLDVRSIKPDIVFYTQAVDVAYPQFKIKSFWKSSLFYYVPYCLNMENEKAGFNTLLFNISLKVFAASEYEKKYWSSFFLNKGKNVVVTGYPSFDYLLSPQLPLAYHWKCHDQRKRIIWAPHHSIAEKDLLHYSNFLDIADDMISIARKYQDKVEFVFKPHPRLRPKLEKRSDWGVKRTSAYYELWDSMPNTKFEDGEYYELFLTSDAMIHDCSTFMAEYLLTEKPVAFVLNKGAELDLNEYAQRCYAHHYELHSIMEIECFINDVVLNERDPMKVKRVEFVHDTLCPAGDKTVAQNIFEEIVSELR